MSEEESYLDNLLKALTNPETSNQPTEEIHTNVVIQDITDHEKTATLEGTLSEETLSKESILDSKEPNLGDAIQDTELDFNEMADLEQEFSFDDLSNDADIELSDIRIKEEDQEIDIDTLNMSETELLQPNLEIDSISENALDTDASQHSITDETKQPNLLEVPNIDVISEESENLGIKETRLSDTNIIPEESERLETEEQILVESELPDINTISEELENLKIEETELPDINTISEELENLGIEEAELSNINTISEELENLEIGETKLPDINTISEELENLEIGETEEHTLESELPNINEILEETELSDIDTMPEVQKMFGTEEKELQETELSDMLESNEILEETLPDISDIDIEAEEQEILGTEEDKLLDIPEISTILEEQEVIKTEETKLADTSDIGIEPEANKELEAGDLELSDIGVISEDNGGELEMPEIPDEMNLDGLEEAITSETALQMAEELNMEDLGDDADINADDIPDIPDVADDLDLLGDIGADKVSSIDSDDNLDDVLSMLDNDAELAEINDMLKKSDNNEPIEDDMMSLLHQMADDEAASVNAGVKDVEDDDGGVPLPELPKAVADQLAEEAKNSGKKKKEGKPKKGKKAGDSDDAADVKGDSVTEATKKPGKLSKFFNMLTEDLVPEPTEEELAAEKAAKEVKKQEELTKKEQEKLEKEEAKKAKAEEKEAAKKAKAEAAQQKNKEKKEAKEKKAAEKRAKQAAEGAKKGKRIPPKKIAAAAAFGASVGGAILVSTSVLSEQGYLQTARKAFYNQDYMTAYQATYGMELDSNDSDGLIQAKSEVILKMERRYDSYQAYLKMGREVEALDALIKGLLTYDFINAEAEQYHVTAEVDAIKEQILNTLEAKYRLDETAARELSNIDDALRYTMALSDVIDGITN